MSGLKIIEISASLIETFLGISVPAILLGHKKLKIKETCVAVSILTGLVMILNQYALFSVLTSLIGIVLMALSTYIIYKTKLLDTIALVGIFMLVIYINDFLSVSFIGVLLKNPALASFVAADSSYQRALFLILSKLLLILVCWCFIRYYQRVDVKSPGLWAGFLFGTGVIGYFANNTFIKTDINTFLTWLLLLLLVLVSAFAFVQNLLSKIEREKSFIEKERLHMLLENYNMFMKNYQDNRMFYHDLKNQYLIIKNYLKNRDYEKTEKFIDNLNLADEPVPIKEYTGVEELDIILAYKTNTAKRQGIRMNIIAEPIPLKTTAAETVALMGNILDNAIDASSKAAPENRWVQVVIRRIKNMSFIKVTNSYSCAPQAENGNLVTQKRNTGLHGIGIESVKKIVEQYGGVQDITYGEGVFSIVVSFFD